MIGFHTMASILSINHVISAQRYCLRFSQEFLLHPTASLCYRSDSKSYEAHTGLLHRIMSPLEVSICHCHLVMAFAPSWIFL